MIVLAFDTTSLKSSLALAQDGVVLAAVEGDQQLPHSQTLFTSLTAVLSSAGINLAQIDLLAGNTGPGSFTGLRVGLAALKGLAQALNRQVIGINALDLTALAVGVEARYLILLEAGRNEVFAGLRMIGPAGSVVSSGADLVSDLPAAISHYQSELDQGVILAGSGVTKHLGQLDEIAGKLGRTMNSLSTLSGLEASRHLLIGKDWAMQLAVPPLAATLAIAAPQYLANAGYAKLKAYYIRKSDAELKLTN